MKLGNKRRGLKGRKAHCYMRFVSVVKTEWILEKQQSVGSAAPVVFSLEQAGPSQTGLTEIEEQERPLHQCVSMSLPEGPCVFPIITSGNRGWQVT